MKRLENETDKEFEERKIRNRIKIVISIPIVLSMIAYTSVLILKMHNKYIKYEPVKERQEETIPDLVLKKTL